MKKWIPAGPLMAPAIVPALVFAALGALASPTFGQNTTDPVLWNLVNRSMAELDPSKFPDISQSRANLDQQIRNFDRYLESSPSQGPLWKSFLKWNDLQKELAEPTPNPEALNDLEKRFRQNYAGLEYSPFVGLRDALSKYVQDSRMARDPNTTMQILKNRLSKLSERMQLPDMERDPKAIHDLAQLVAYMKQANQSPEFVSSILSRYSQPNIRAIVSDDFLRKSFARPVDQANPVSEVILGTTIIGQSILCGNVSPVLLENPNQATLRLLMNADFASVNKGYNRGVVLNTTGSADVVACETLSLGDTGLMALGDTGADAQLSTVIQSIEHRLKIVRKIAAKQAAKKKPQADAIGEARMENRIRTQFHQQLTEQLSEANRKLREAMESPLISRLGISKPQRNSWSNPEQLGLRWKVQSGTQLASDMPCPFPIDDCGLTLQIHESVVGNLLDPVLAGRILRSDEIDAYAAQFGDAAKGIPRKEEDGPWAITLNNFQPVETVFDDNLIKFRVTTSRLEREDQALPNTATVEAAYKIVQADGTIQLERQGDLNVEFAGKVQQGTRGVVLRTFLKNKFEQLFREKLFDSPIRWSDRLPDQFKDLQLCAVGIDDGWLQLQIR
jgi:chorismate mutase